MTEADEFDFENSSAESQSLMTMASDIEVGCRVHLSRNMAEFPFLDVCSDDHRSEIETAVRSTVKQVRTLNQLTIIDCQQLELMEHQFLADLHAVLGWSKTSDSRMADTSDPTEVAVETLIDSTNSVADAKDIPAKMAEQGAEAATSLRSKHIQGALSQAEVGADVILNEEDHLRIQVSCLGQDLQNVWSVANDLDDQFEQKISFAFSPQWGYLTPCPANVGTGLRASVTLHLRALNVSGEIHDVLRRIARSNVVGHEIFGDPAGGDFYRFSNQATLGLTENELIDQVSAIIPEIVSAERAARQAWLKNDREPLQQEFSTAVKKLNRQNLTKRSDSQRFKLIQSLSVVRMGLEMGLLDQASISQFAKNFELIQQRAKLTEAIAAENYRFASRLRDRIRFLSGGAA